MGPRPLLPSDTVAAVRAQTGRLAEGILAAVKAENEIYAGVLDGPEGMGIRLGIEQAIRAFLDGAQRGERPGAEAGEVWRRLGEAEFQAGRGLEALRAAWRSGTRAAWRGAAMIAGEAGISTPAVVALAEAIFVYTDELATGVFEGYVRMQSDEASERERRRRRLASLLLDAEVHDPETIARAAELARFTLPRTLAVLALPGEEPGPVARRLGAEALSGSDREGAFVVVSDPAGPGRGPAIARAVGAADAALGPTVAPREAQRSLRWARTALGLVQRGALPSEHPTRAQDHLATIVMLGDEEVARAFVQARLAPLHELGDGERQRLLDTLEAWLDHQRHTPRVAAQLHVHPQTVRYRLAKLRELMGDQLERAEGRFELELALRVRRLI
jgi:PucR C-terminal helix-turn-helix domain